MLCDEKRCGAYAAGVVLAVVFAVISLISSSIIYIGDDLVYQYNLHKYGELMGDMSQPSTPIGNLVDVVMSQCTHYMGWNGRFVAHTIVQCVVSFLPPVAYGLLNGLMYVLLIVVVARLSCVRLTDVSRLIVLSCLLLLGYDTMYTVAVQVGYVWMAALSLLFLAVFYSDKIASEKKWGILGILFIFSFVAGAAHESFSVGLAVAVAAWAIVNRGRMSTARWIMAVGFFLGVVALCAAPGSLARAGNLHIALLDSIQCAAKNVLLTWILIAILGIKLIAQRLDVRRLWHDNMVMIIFLVVELVFNLAVGVYCRRQLLGVELASLIILMHESKNISLHGRVAKIAIILLCCLTAKVLVWRYNYVNRQVESIGELYELYVASPDGNVHTNLFESDEYVEDVPFYVLSSVYVPHLIDMYFKYTLHGTNHFEVVPDSVAQKR